MSRYVQNIKLLKMAYRKSDTYFDQSVITMILSKLFSMYASTLRVCGAHFFSTYELCAASKKESSLLHWEKVNARAI